MFYHPMCSFPAQPAELLRWLLPPSTRTDTADGWRSYLRVRLRDVSTERVDPGAVSALGTEKGNHSRCDGVGVIQVREMTRILEDLDLSIGKHFPLPFSHLLEMRMSSRSHTTRAGRRSG